MYNGQKVSLKQILWTVLNHPLANDLTYDTAAEFAVECIKLIGIPFSFKNEITEPPLILNNHKALLPNNLTKINGIRLISNDMIPERSAVALRYATDIYHESNQKNTLEEFTYNIQNNVIYTSFPDGCLEVSYECLDTDKDGYPLIPDNPKYKLAVEYYILYRYLAPLWDIGKISDKAFNRITQNYEWYVGGAQTSMQIKGVDHFQSVMNSINRIILNVDAHKNFYNSMGNKERIKRY